MKAGRLLVLLLALVAAPDAGADVRARLATPPVLRGEFVQEKQLAGFPAPLVSRGRFLLVRDTGVAWDTRAPVTSSVVLTADERILRQDGGAPRRIAHRRSGPGARETQALLQALLAGDFDALATRFEMEEGAGGAGAWTLSLRPRAAALRRVFARIDVAGDRFVERVEIVSGEGERTVITFAAVEAADAPGADEAARFD